MKFVLVRSRLGNLFVIEKEHWVVYNAQCRQMGEAESVLIAESSDRDELRRFQALTETED
jgi:hypothetical protein